MTWSGPLFDMILSSMKHAPIARRIALEKRDIDKEQDAAKNPIKDNAALVVYWATFRIKRGEKKAGI